MEDISNIREGQLLWSFGCGWNWIKTLDTHIT